MPTPIFTGCMIGYAIGIVATVAGLVLMDTAQPALLYLVPSCTLSTMISALVYGRFKDLWKFSCVEEKPKEKTKNTWY